MPVDGDQHGLLIGLVTWTRSLGLEVVCGGKARPVDFIYDESTGAESNLWTLRQEQDSKWMKKITATV